MQPGRSPANWYHVLGVAQSASSDEIRAAYRRAALRLHPDKAATAGPNNGAAGFASLGDIAAIGDGAAERFLLVQQAWQVGAAAMPLWATLALMGVLWLP
jgi:DnaJ-class molecular chaperone